MTRELPQMGCDRPSVVNPRTKVSKKRHAPRPRKAKPFRRWSTSRAEWGFRWIKFDGEIVSEWAVAKLLNRHRVVLKVRR